MKKILLVLFTMSYFSGFGQPSGFPPGFFDPLPARVLDTPKLEVFYNLTFQYDSLDASSLREESMLLLIGEEISVFSSYNKYRHDSLFIHLDNATIQKKKADLAGFLASASRLPTRFRFRIYKNFPSNQMTTIDRVFSYNFKYVQPLRPFTWTLTDEKKEISGFRVQKATTRFGGRYWIAWFAPEIPVSDGPFKFGGLPGLIIFLHDTRNHYVFEMVSMNLNTNRKVEFPERNYIKTTKRDFLRAQVSFRSDISTHAAAFVVERHAQQVMVENMRRRNNPILLRAE